MKKITLTAVALALLVAGTDGAQAQSFSVGAFGGWNSATLDLSQGVFTRADNLSGFNAGAVLGWNVSEKFTVDLAGMYTQKGSAVEDEGQLIDLSVDLIEIPLLARVTIPTQAGDRLSLHFFAGPAISFETSCKVSGDNNGQRVELNCDDPQVQAEHHTTDYSLLFGGGVGIGAGPGDIQLDVAYDLGLRNLNSEVGDDAVIKTRALMLTAGYRLPIRGW
jgi:hypothetical protein